MKNRIGIVRMSLMAMLCLTAFSCTSTPVDEGEEDLVVENLVFSSDFKNAQVYVSADDEFKGVLSIDSLGTNVKVVERFKNRYNIMPSKLVSMKVEKVKNLTADFFRENGFDVLLLVDLTLPQESVDAERLAVKHISDFINDDRLYISFLKSGGEITKTELITDYILDNCFFTDNGAGDKHLYEGIYTKLLELDKGASPIRSSQKKVMFVMSDGKVWDEVEAYDPDHFATEQKLFDYASKSKWEGCFFYSNFSHDDSDDLYFDSRNMAILSLCNKLGGLYQDTFIWSECRNFFEEKIDLPRHEFLLSLSNHEGREYDGVARQLVIEVNGDDESQALTGSTTYMLGNEFFPIIVHGVNNKVIAVRGVYLLISILVLAFLILQFIVPLYKYISFYKKNVYEYVGPNMCVNGMEVADTCYLCKAPFRKGETIVAKCQHTMHFECWEENGYHCPEYSARCKTGSHYYNRFNILDLKNSPFFSKWIYFAIIAAVFGWFFFYFFTGDSFSAINNELVTSSLVNDNSGRIDDFNSYMAFLPAFSFYLILPLVFMLSLLIDKERSPLEKFKFVSLRTLAASALAIIIFTANNLFCITVDSYILEEIVELISWVILVYGVSLCLTYRSSAAKPDKKFYTLLLAAALVVFLWSYLLYLIVDDYRLLISLCFLAFDGLIAFAVARVSPRSNHYVLHAEGSIKSTSIALYKWFRSNPDAVVTLGRSVDCNIQMSWDIQGDIAPVQAEIFMRDSNIYLRALERGVIVGSQRMLRPDETIELYQKRHFTIGKTTFTYMETDI